MQAYNTKKSDGTGREVLRECHRLLFDGVRFLVHVDLVPLEDVTVATWYGLQCTTLSPWRGTGHYIGGTNRAMFDASAATDCGDKSAAGLVLQSGGNVLEMRVDPAVDLGDRRFYAGTQGIFTKTYDKAYFYIIQNTDLLKDSVYTLEGSYRFYSE